MAAEPADEGTIRAKYWDWCSARLADRFLALSADEIYRIAQREPGEPSAALPAAGGVAVGQDAGPLGAESATSFRQLVARVTEILARDMGLPCYEQWAAAYRDDPARFDTELLGLWREGESAGGGGGAAG